MAAPTATLLQLALVFSLQREIGLCTTCVGTSAVASPSESVVGLARGSSPSRGVSPCSCHHCQSLRSVSSRRGAASGSVALSLSHVEGRTDHTPERRDLRGPCQHVARHCTPRKGEPRGGVRRVCDKPILTLRSARNAPAVCAHRQLLAPELRRIDHVDAHAYVVARKPINLNHDTRVRPREGLAKQTNTMRR